MVHRELALSLGYTRLAADGEGAEADPEAELVAFFESDWLDYLTRAVSLDTETYLAALRRRPSTRAEYNAKYGAMD